MKCGMGVRDGEIRDEVGGGKGDGGGGIREKVGWGKEGKRRNRGRGGSGGGL